MRDLRGVGAYRRAPVVVEAVEDDDVPVEDAYEDDAAYAHHYGPGPWKAALDAHLNWKNKINSKTK